MTTVQPSNVSPPAPSKDGATDQWEAARQRAGERSSLPANSDLFWSEEEKQAHQRRNAELFENYRRAEEAGLEKERLKRGLGAAGAVRQADPASIRLEFAMAGDTATTRLSYLMDPYLPSRCVVGFYGRGGTAKSSFLASAAAEISNSEDASTLWVSVEELTDWIKVRHIKIGGVQGTLAVVAAVASKIDAHGRAIGSSFNVYEHLEPALVSAKANFESLYNPPKPLRLVVLDTAVGLTTWAKGETPNDDASVKRLLGYLQALAERHDVTIAIIGHSNKGKHDHFADTVAGASAWTNSPRLSFVHARDQHEEFGCVMQVAKSNLTQRFATSYTTEPVHTLHHRDEGADSVLCRVNFGDVVWGEEEATDLFEAATKRQQDDDQDGAEAGGRPNLVQSIMATVVEMVHGTAQPVSREAVEARAGRTFSRREWKKVDDRLDAAAFMYKVAVRKGAQNKVTYERAA